MKIVTIPHPSLRQTAEPIAEVSEQLVKFVNQLQQTLKRTTNPKGVGLAGPQVDKLWRVFATQLNDELKYYLNPEIIEASGNKILGADPEEPDMEGCLSIPGLYGPVPRHDWIEFNYQTIEGDQLIDHQQKLTGFSARVVQHEIDHLDGILFTDYSLENELPVYRAEGKKWVEIDPSLIEVI